jgi:malonate transporter and related proteins
MLEILDLALPFFGLILLGVVAARHWGRGEEGLVWLNIFLVYFALPALIFRTVAAAPFEKLVDWPFVGATTSVTIATFFGAFAASRLLFATAPRTAALQGTAASYGNVGYMGLPLAVAFFGPEAAVPAALVFCFDCATQFVLAPLLVTLIHEENEETHAAVIVRRIAAQVLSHPFIIATLLGVVASALRFQPPEAVATLLDMLMKAAGPCALFALGVTVSLRRFSGIGGTLPMVVATKTLLQPIAAYLVLSLVPGLDPVWRHAGVMMAALPTASNAFILATQYDANVEGASTAVIVSTVMSAFTIPAFVYLIRAGILV